MHIKPLIYTYFHPNSTTVTKMIHSYAQIIHETEFPFNIYTTQATPASYLDHPFIHRHDCLEINYVMGGKGYYLFDDKKYELHVGDIYIINNREYHMAYNTGDLVLKVITFDADLVWNGSKMDYMYLKAFFDRKAEDSPFLSVHQAITSTVASIIMDIDREWQERNPGYQIMIKADLLKMLGMIYRYYVEAEQFETNSSRHWSNHHAILQAVDYINAHYQERVTLKTMANMVHMSENHFSSLFSKIMQVPFSKYVLEKRLQQACILLKITDKSVSYIASSTGFDTISYFNRTFKNRYGMSPRQYRTENKSNTTGSDET